ncbi:hypothetical protein ACJMK2_026785 [Sinanodonta woodiana]|uniref:Uncharacterized protein n=1 Tax=Sinanodonta woodiana TaxID=1069815 RepID=A0ABD3XKR7_SINWO
MEKELDDERNVEYTNQCRMRVKLTVVSNSTEMAYTDKCEDIEVDKLSAINANMLSKKQIADFSLQSIIKKSFAIREEAKEEPMTFFWENDILRRK